MAILLLILFLIPGAAHASWVFSLEGGRVSSGYNDVQIPNNPDGSRFSLVDDLESAAATFWRLRVACVLTERSTLSMLIAPLSIDISGAAPREIRFNGETFAAGTPLTGTYRFNSYRLTYRYDDHISDRLEIGYGVTAKLRDARIELNGDGRMSVKDNVGFVPLLNILVRWLPAGPFGMLLEGDALAAPQGRAEDVLLALTYDLSDAVQSRFGYRLLEGGADVDEVYTFAWLHYAVAGLVVSF